MSPLTPIHELGSGGGRKAIKTFYRPIRTHFKCGKPFMPLTKDCKFLFVYYMYNTMYTMYIEVVFVNGGINEVLAINTKTS